MRAIPARPAGGRNLDACQPERCIPILMPGEPVPQTHHQDAQQLVSCIEAIECRQLATPRVACKSTCFQRSRFFRGAEDRADLEPSLLRKSGPIQELSPDLDRTNKLPSILQNISISS